MCKYLNSIDFKFISIAYTNRSIFNPNGLYYTIGLSLGGSNNLWLNGDQFNFSNFDTSNKNL